jgi:hypothetical protein
MSKHKYFISVHSSEAGGKKSQCLILSRISVAAFFGTQKKLARRHKEKDEG